jgi:phage/plasmid primase-like uncharacterized protein
MDGVAHRLQIGRRFAARVGTGDAVFMTGAGGVASLPCTITDEVTRHFSGVNRMMLLQVMKDQAWSDPRFFTSDQIKQAGWQIGSNAKTIGLQFLVAVGLDGLVPEVPELKRFNVYNASEINGVPACRPVAQAIGTDIATALNRAGIECSAACLDEGLHQWLSASQQIDAECDRAEAELRVALAMVLVKVQTTQGTQGTQPTERNESAKFAEVWQHRIEAEPLTFYHSVKASELLAATVMRQIHDVTRERVVIEQMAAENVTAVKLAVENAVKQNLHLSGGNVANQEKASEWLIAQFDRRQALLEVPYAEKGAASDAGARYYPPKKVWFVPDGKDLLLFDQWRAKVKQLGPMASKAEKLASFMKEMASCGLDTAEDIVDDGAWHNVAVGSKRSIKNRSGSYVVDFEGGNDGCGFGTIINKHTGQQTTWVGKGRALTPEQRVRSNGEAVARAEQAEREKSKIQELVAASAAQIWDLCQPPDHHDYLTKKGISGEGLRKIHGAQLLEFSEFKGENGATVISAMQWYLIAPLHNEAGQLRNLQAVSGDGVIKAFMRGGQKKGMMLVLGAASFDALVEMEVDAVCYVEGVATGQSLQGATGVPVVVCFDAGNMETVAIQTIPKLRERTQAVLARDNDQYHVERALGQLGKHLGVNPFGETGPGTFALVNDGRGMREVPLGDVKADGQWHQVEKGSYSMCLEMQGEAGGAAAGETLENNITGGAVETVVLKIIPTGENEISIKLLNRGSLAARNIIETLAATPNGTQASTRRGPALLDVTPQFVSSLGRPTDWNDLAQREGKQAVAALLEQAGVALATRQHGTTEHKMVKTTLVSRGVAR